MGQGVEMVDKLQSRAGKPRSAREAQLDTDEGEKETSRPASFSLSLKPCRPHKFGIASTVRCPSKHLQ